MTLNSIREINAGIISSCVLGLALSCYAYVIETSKEVDASYSAMCDISEHISCTKAFMSDYGKGFGIVPKDSLLYLPNSVYGVAFYTSFAIIGIFNTRTPTTVLIVLAILSNLGSIYLAFVLYLLRDICLICISTYLVNAANLFLASRKLTVLAIVSESGDGFEKRKTN